MREFQGMVGSSSLNKSVAPSSSTTQLSLSQSMIVLSKSKTTTIPAISCIFPHLRTDRECQKATVSTQEINSTSKKLVSCFSVHERIVYGNRLRRKRVFIAEELCVGEAEAVTRNPNFWKNIT